jgi:hypothetical protein
MGEGISREGEIVDLGVVPNWWRSPAPGMPTTARKSARARTTRANFSSQSRHRPRDRNKVRASLGVPEANALMTADMSEEEQD